MTSSLYNSATGVQAPHCLHAIGIGRTGAVYIEALLRTGEIEDLLTDPRATFAAMVVDIGDQDMGVVTDYANSFKKRLESRGIPAERFQFQAIALPIPEKAEFFEGLNRTREFLKLEYPRYYWNPNFESYVPHKIKMPAAGGHIPRVVAKGIYANAYYAGERPLDVALRNFVDQVEKAMLPSLVMVAFSMAGGTGSGIALDLARHLSNSVFGRRMLITGIGIAPHADEALADGGGSVISIGTTAVTEHFASGSGSYSAFKAAVTNWTLGQAQVLGAKGVRCNVVSPGPIFIEGGDWNMIKDNMAAFFEATQKNHPGGELGTAQDVADVVTFLASERAKHVNGVNITVDGGFLKRVDY